MDTIRGIKYSMELTTLRFCKYRLLIGDKSIDLTFPQLLQLRERINYFTNPLKLSEIIDNENFILLCVADRKNVLYLEIWQLLDLKDEIFCFFNQLDYN